MAKLKKIKLNNKDNDFVGGNKAEKILGNGGNDTIDGGKGNDKLYGGGGKDTLISKAGEGNDLLDGGKGKDTAVIGGNFADAVITETAKGFKIQIDGRTITTKSIETFQFDDRTLTKAQMKNDAPTADATQDVSGNEDASITGTVVGADVDGDTLTYSITGAATNGNVTIDAATGEFTYTPNGDYNGADSFVVTIDDGRGGTTTQTVNVTVDPVNDAAVIGGDDAAAITEGDAPITGTLTIADVDGAAEEAFTAETVAGTYGDLEIDAAGNWTYTLGAGAEALAAGEEATDTITVTSADGTTHDITVTVTGVNDAAVIGGDTAGSVDEGAAAPIGGTLTVADADAGESGFQAVNPASLNGTYGTFTFNESTGEWTYTVGAGADALATGASDTDELTVTSTDGTTQTITVTVTGTNDAPEITTTGSVIDDNNGDAAGGTGDLADLGFSVSDEDNADFNGGSLTIASDQPFSGADVIDSFASGDFYMVGNQLVAKASVLGTATDEVIGTVTTTTVSGDATSVTIDFSNSAVTSSVVQALVDDVVIKDIDDGVDANITVTVTDPNGASDSVTALYDTDGDAVITDFDNDDREIEVSDAAAIDIDDGTNAAFDSNGSEISGGTLTISGVRAGDTLKFVSPVANGVELLGTNLVANTTGGGTPLVIGTVNAVPGAGDTLIITFNGNATDTAVSNILKALQVDASGETGDLTITVDYVSGDGNDTLTSSHDISVVDDFTNITLADLQDASTMDPVTIDGNRNIEITGTPSPVAFDIDDYIADEKIIVSGSHLIRFQVTDNSDISQVVGLDSLGTISVESIANTKTLTANIAQVEALGAIDVEGAIAITDLENDLAADLSDVVADGGLTATLALGASNLTFTGDFGDAEVTVMGSGDLTASAAVLSGVDIDQSGTGDIVVSDLSTGAVFDLSTLDASGGGHVIINFATSTTLNAATNLGAGHAVITVSPNVVLTLSAAQADDLVIDGEDGIGAGQTGGSIVVTGLGTDAVDLSGIAAGGAVGLATAGSLTANIDADAADPNDVVTIDSNTDFGDFDIVVPSGITMAAGIDQVDGLDVSGGSVALTMAANSAADLSGITSDATVTVTSDSTFSGDFGDVDVVVNDSVTLTADAANINGRTVTVGQDGGVMDMDSGAIIVIDLENSLAADLSGVVSAGVAGDLTAMFGDAAMDNDLDFTGDFGDFDVVVGENQTLHVLATQIAGLTVTGEAGNDDVGGSDGGSIVATLTTGTYDLSGVTVDVTGTFTGLVTGTLSLASGVDLGDMTEIELNDGDDDVDGDIAFTLSATQADGIQFVSHTNSSMNMAVNGTLDGYVVITAVTGNTGDDLTLNGSAGNDTIGDGDGNDTIRAGDGNDTINAALGDDTIDGGNGNDVINGGDGNDRIIGGAGIDTMDGGDGDDTFVFAAGDSGIGSGNRDIINGFTDFGIAGGDVLEIADEGNTFGMADFIGTAAFTNTGETQVRYVVVGGNAIVEVDSDGSGAADYQIQLNGVTVLTDSDFQFA